jgi:FHS family glucose/mannose:H+ symporter-like MFS transporter
VAALTRERKLTWLCYACLMMVGVNSGWIGPFLPEISRIVILPIDRAGLIVSASAAGYFISVLVAGETSESWSAQAILIGAMILFTAGLFGLGAARGLGGLLASGFVIGLANGGIDVGANALIVELNRDRMASALNYLHVLFGVGALLGPMIVAGALAQTISYSRVFATGAIACALIALALVATPALEILTSQEQPGGLLPMLARPLIWVVGGVMLLYVGAEVGIGAWLFVYLRRAGAVSTVLASSGVSLYWLGLVAGRMAGGRLAHRFSIPQFTVMSCALSALALIGLITAPSNHLAAALMVMLIGLGYGPVFPNMIATGAARFPSEVGRMTSIVVAAGAIGGTFVPLIMGRAIAMSNVRASMEIALGVTASMALLAMALTRFETPR